MRIPLPRGRFLITLLLATLLIGLASQPTSALAQTPEPVKPVVIYLFWGDGCPHCARAKPYFENLASKYPGVQLHLFEVYYNEDNQRLFSQMAQRYGLDSLGVPTIWIGPYYLQGYSEELNPEIEKVVVQCLRTGCSDPASTLAASPTLTPTRAASPLLATSAPPAVTGPLEHPAAINQPASLNLPVIGKIDLAAYSITASTILIAFVDGFNPCSLWVLSVLLALTLHTGSRKKVFLIGLVFLTVTALIYALFILGLFSVLKIASFLGWIQILVSLLTLSFAVINIKDYFWYKEGLSLTISDSGRTGILKRMRTVVQASQSFWGLVSATVILAAGVSLVEFSCTAGFPVVWVNLLSAQKIGGATFIFLLLLYMLIYQLDELLIFGSAVISLKSSRLEEKHGRLLKLVGGMLMLALSITMLVNPSSMNNIGSSLLIFASAFAATFLVYWVHQKVLPRFGIWIGTKSR